MGHRTPSPRAWPPIVALLLVLTTTLAPAAPALADEPAGAATASSEASAGDGGAEAKAQAASEEEEGGLIGWLKELAPILILLTAIGIVIARLPKIELGHSPEFLRRRVLNWLPLGLTYAFLYMGRYNLATAKIALGDLMTAADFSAIFAAGTVTYGLSFVINGPLTDRIGGKKAILIGAGGSALMNLLMGLTLFSGVRGDLVSMFSVLYAANMYFQSFGAVAIVKVNAPWFHVRERGVFGAIFGILISLGIYFAFDWSALILKATAPAEAGSVAYVAWVFFIPAAILAVFWLIDAAWVRDSPGQAGHADFDTADASSGDDAAEKLTVVQVFSKMLRNPIIMTIAFIEFCSGFLRQAIMQYYKIFSKAVGATEHFVYQNWGLLLCCAGILGGVVAGVISDRVFGSRRGPVAALLYGVMLIGAIAGVFLLTTPLLGWLAIMLSMAVIGVHGMLSGTASMDFGGRKNVGIAVGIIDGFVYLGTGAMSLTYFFILPEGTASHNPDNWHVWPLAMVPMALVGLLLATRIWQAMPKGKQTPEVKPAAPATPGGKSA